MKWLTKVTSKRHYYDSQKDIEDILNVIPDIYSITATNNCANNSGTDMANCVINDFLKNDILYEK